MARRTKKTTSKTSKTSKATTNAGKVRVSRHGLGKVLDVLKHTAETGQKMEGHVTSFAHMCTTAEGELCLTTTDMNVSTTALIDPEPAFVTHLSQDAVLPVAIFQKLVQGGKKGDEQAVDLEVLKDSATETPNYRVGKDQVALTVDGMTTRLTPDNSPDNFPAVARALGASEAKPLGGLFLIDHEQAQRSLEYVLRAVGDDQSNPTRTMLHNVLLDIDQQRFVATDGHRQHLGGVKFDDDGMLKRDATRKNWPACGGHSELARWILLPGLFAQQVARVLKLTDRDGGKLTLVKNRNANHHELHFTAASIGMGVRWEIRTIMPVDTFPDYRKVIPHNLDSRVRIDRGDFIKLCKRIKAICGREVIPTKIEIGKDQITATIAKGGSATTTDLGGCTFQAGKYNVFGINVDYMLDAINIKENNNVLMSTSGDFGQILFDNENGLWGIMMPMRI